MERTFVLVKPGVVQRRICGAIISRFEQKSLKIVGMKLLQVSQELGELHYAEHREKPFYGELIEYITSSPVLAMVIEGDQAISIVRLLTGATKVESALPGTIRGDFAQSTIENIVHASDSSVSADREISLYFSAKELVSW